MKLYRSVTPLFAAIATGSVAVLGGASIAEAASLTTNAAGEVVSIEDLEISGVGTYNVTFHSGSFDDLFDLSLANGVVGTDGRMGPTFWGLETEADAATKAIIELLGDSLAIAESSSVEPRDGFQIPWGQVVDSSGASSIQLYRDAIPLLTDELTSVTVPSDILFGEGAEGNRLAGVSWAKFSVADDGGATAVPEPSALLGLATALGLGAFAHRRDSQQMGA